MANDTKRAHAVSVSRRETRDTTGATQCSHPRRVAPSSAVYVRPRKASDLK